MRIELLIYKNVIVVLPCLTLDQTDVEITEEDGRIREVREISITLAFLFLGFKLYWYV